MYLLTLMSHREPHTNFVKGTIMPLINSAFAIYSGLPVLDRFSLFLFLIFCGFCFGVCGVNNIDKYRRFSGYACIGIGTTVLASAFSLIIFQRF